MMNVKYEKQDVQGWLLALDVVVTVVLVVSATLLIYNSYMAGALLGAAGESTAAQRLRYWRMMTNVAFLTGSLAYLFGRYFKDRFAELHNPWL
jgi:hypothetical protein